MIEPKQIAALRYMIFNAKDGTEPSKRVLAFLIDKSERLSKEVCLTLVADREGYSAAEIQEIFIGFTEMQSSKCTTHLSELLDLIGSKLRFSLHYGDFDPTRDSNKLNTVGMFSDEGTPVRCTFWLSEKPYSEEASLVITTRNELQLIDLSKPGLYPTLETT